MIDFPSGPGQFILSKDGKSWLPVTAPAKPAPDSTPAPEPEDSTDGLQRSDSLPESGDGKRDA